VFPLICVGTLTLKWPWKGLIGYNFQEKLTKLSSKCLKHSIRDTVYTDWLGLISCATFSPTVCTQVQENLLLPFSNSPPTSVNSIWRGMSSRLLRYHDENIRHARRPVLHSFPGKLCRPLHMRVARCVAQCRSTPKAV
jgi:hypothetical protein